MNFYELTQNPFLQKAIEKKGYEEATEIQEKVIPLIQNGVDIIGQSQTGTGKTAAFAIPTLEKIQDDLKAQILILTPTRELAVQVADEYNDLAQFMRGVKALAVFGGDPIQRQIQKLKDNPQIIVGTPGRLMDHMRRRTIRFDNLHTIILDEADEMLRMGFREDIEEILKDVHTDTQRLLFSATMPKAILDITHQFLSDPAHVQIKRDSVTVDTIKQQYVAIQKPYKQDVLYRLLDAKQPKRCLVFCNTKKMVDEIIQGLQDRGYIAERIHGDMKQEQRMSTLKQFNRGSIQILVATDVAARGLDIEHVDLVINYDLPDSDEYYVHRIGRSGRAGNIGESITILTYKEHDKLRELEKFIDKKVERIQVPSLKRLNELKVEHFIKNLLLDVQENDYIEYADIIRKLQDEGIAMELIVASLLKDALRLHEQVDERDLNDYSFGKPKQKGRGRTPYGEKKSFGDKKPYAKRGDKPYPKRDQKRKEYGGKDFGRKPKREKKSY